MMLETIRNRKGEAVLGVFLVLFFLLMVGGKVAKDAKAPATVQEEANAQD